MKIKTDGEGYGWSQLSQWDSPPVDAYISHRTAVSGLSREVCRFMLVNRIDTGGGYLRCEYVKNTDVTPDMLSSTVPF